MLCAIVLECRNFPSDKVLSTLLVIGFGDLVGFEPHVKDPHQCRIYLSKCFASVKVLNMSQKRRASELK